MPIFTSHKKRRIALVAVAAAVALGVGGVAYAYWTGNGTGQGTATTGATSDFRIFTSDPTGDPLTPGGPEQTIAFEVDNPGTGSELLSNMTVYVANPDGSTWTDAPGCSAADYSVGTATVPFGEIAGGDSVTGSVTVSMINTDLNQDACQGVTVPLYFTTNAPL